MEGRDERALEVGLFRYSLIRAPADRSLSKAERGRLVRELAARQHVGPDGRLITVGRSTLDDWIRAYGRGGFDALCPRARQSGPLTPARVLALAEQLKRELPERTTAQVHQIMVAAGERPPTVRTLQRHFERAGLNVGADGRTPDRVYGRFQASRRNELWTGDGLHGPKIADRTAILLAFIDDYSRLLVGYRWGVAEDVLRLEPALRSGLSARGVPEAILVDRGSAFVSSQLLRACAVIGIRLIHASPRAATTKGKIERFFRTVRGQFLVELQKRKVADLAELNGLFQAWVESVYHRREHTETGQPPLERFQAAGPPRLSSPELLREAFLWQETRTVTKTATVSLHGNRYEVDGALVGRRCDLIFDPFDLSRIEVRYRGRPLELWRSRSGSAATPTRRPGRTQSRRRRPPGSTTWGWCASSASATFAARGSTTASWARAGTPTTTKTTTRSRDHEHRSASQPLRVRADAVLKGPGALDAARPPLPPGGGRADLLVRVGAPDRGDLRRVRRGQDRRRARRGLRAGRLPAHGPLPGHAGHRATRNVLGDRLRAGRARRVSTPRR